MHALSILLVLLIGGVFIVTVVAVPFSSESIKGPRRWLILVAASLLVVGAVGFFGSALSAIGGLNWLPNSFEWPAGYSGGVISTADAIQVVPHVPSGRVQLYDPKWRFMRGWHVDASGGYFKVMASDKNRIDVVTARGQWHYVFDMQGTLISKKSYLPASYTSFPDHGEAMVVPTAPWLWAFSHPAISWSIGVLGMGILIIVEKFPKGRGAI